MTSFCGNVSVHTVILTLNQKGPSAICEVLEVKFQGTLAHHTVADLHT